MTVVMGTLGYQEAVEQFAQASAHLDFEHINKDFLPFLPSAPASVLDLGAGIGQNAHALAKYGYKVTAVEPLQAFVKVGKTLFPTPDIRWLQDSLPSLEQLTNFKNAFDFILLDGVWHHLHPTERPLTVVKIANMLHKEGGCAISLRNGPAGVGKHVFQTSVEEIEALARQIGLNCIVISQDQPSKMKNKENVTWSRVILKKRSETVI